MEDRKNTIIALLEQEAYVPMKAKELAIVLGVPKKEYSDFKKLLKELEDEYEIMVDRKMRYYCMDQSKYIQGIFHSHEKGFGFVEDEKKGIELYIPIGYTKQALNGDRVLVQKLTSNMGEKREEGKIVKIIKHEKDVIVGTFEYNRNFGFVIPDDKKLGSDIFISKKNFGKAKNHDKVVVKIKTYPEKGKKPEGKIIEVIGNENQAGIDLLSLVKEYRLPYEFPEPVKQEAKAIKQEIAKKDIPNRMDLRDKEIFTIDGEDAKDLDDAVCVEKTEEGTYKLGVHIADVSYYVEEDSRLDKEARLRGTSIYLMDRVIPMLPQELSNGICSLNEKQDRFALSILMEINQKGEVISSDIAKTVINVSKRMSYNKVSKALLGEDIEIVKEYEKYLPQLRLMEELALILKAKREKDGSLNLDIPESKIILNENGVAIDVRPYEMTFANEIIEQFMLIANETIAEKFYWLEAPFIYRVHEVPAAEKITELNRFLYSFGYRIKGQKDSIHPKAFSSVLEKAKGTDVERVVSNLLLRTLKVAHYEAENKGHFGIASKYYCHFTSPIRRYPDLFIHRIISTYLNQNYQIKEQKIEELKQKATKYAEDSSEREKVAQKVERESESIKKAEYMSQKIGEQYDGIISSVTSFGIFVELPNTVEGLIRFENLGQEYYIYDEEHKQLIGEITGKTFKLGDPIKIQVIDAKKDTRRIDFARIESE